MTAPVAPPLTRRRRRLGRISFIILAALVVLVGAGAAWAYLQLRASLPLLEGSRPLPGLGGPVTVTRDAQGIPTIRGASRVDVSRATGFLHAQDRFFQMDLSRRRAAGELSALVGAAALPLDTDVRRHRFRAQTEKALTLLTPADRELLDAYTQGVNEGLSALGARPFEYFILGQEPRPWRAEDSLLVVLSMFLTLQDSDGSYESALGTMRNVLPPEMFDFMVSPGTEWDAPVIGERFAVPPVPGREVYDLRARRRGERPVVRPGLAAQRAISAATERLARALDAFDAIDPATDDSARGSNNWAVAGGLTSNGGALLANDMHLLVRVPNVWYRAVLEWPDASVPEGRHQLIGVMLPGVPALVVGSNTHVAWGFTNTYADWGDLILLELDPQDPTRYRTPEGWRTLERHDEIIEVAGEAPRTEPVFWTIWGPVLGPDYRNQVRAFRWVAHDAARLASAGTAPERARTLEQLFEAANGIGAPGQNLVAADRSGRIGWTIYGSIPRRTGGVGPFPTSWSEGGRGWDGWLDSAQYPRIVDPPGGRIWTANARVVDGEMLSALGDGSYEVGSRATMIRDRLTAAQEFTPATMLEIQLDTRAVFLQRWRELILRSLTPALVAGDPGRAAFRDVVERDWTGEASPESAGYRLTRMFREELSERVMTFVLAECYEADWTFDHTVLRRREGPVWKLVTERPMHLLDPQYESWDELIGATVDEVMARVTPEGELSRRTWAEYNVTRYRHPLSAALPVVGRWLDMPHQPLAGDLFTTNMHWGAQAPSERMVVSPGREAEGIMHMPTGQSGHPLSPFYASSHDSWVKGEATSFMPGPARHTLTLTP